MADTKISALTEDTAPDLVADYLVTADTSATASKKVKPSALLGPTPNAQTGTTYTYVLADAFKTVTLSNASAIAVTIPTNASVAFPIGTKIRNYRLGAGRPTISPDSGVTLRLPTGIPPNRFMGVSTKKAADQTGANYTGAGAYLAFDSETGCYDTDAFHDTVTENTKLIIPTGLGIKKVKLVGRINTSDTAGGDWAYTHIDKNGSADYVGNGACNSESSATNAVHNVSTADVAVSDSDYFQLGFINESDTSITINAAPTYFALKVTEINPVGSIAYQYGYVTIEKIGTNEWIMYGPALG